MLFPCILAFPPFDCTVKVPTALYIRVSENPFASTTISRIVCTQFELMNLGGAKKKCANCGVNSVIIGFNISDNVGWMSCIVEWYGGTIIVSKLSICKNFADCKCRNNSGSDASLDIVTSAEVDLLNFALKTHLVR